jgi:hypothetical protein
LRERRPAKRRLKKFLKNMPAENEAKRCASSSALPAFQSRHRKNV